MKNLSLVLLGLVSASAFADESTLSIVCRGSRGQELVSATYDAETGAGNAFNVSPTAEIGSWALYDVELSEKAGYPFEGAVFTGVLVADANEEPVGTASLKLGDATDVGLDENGRFYMVNGNVDFLGDFVIEAYVDLKCELRLK